MYTYFLYINTLILNVFIKEKQSILRMTKTIFLLLIVVGIITGDGSSPQLLINTSSLGLIQGEINPLVNNVRQFIGIPFAQPPVGVLRFKPPISLVNASSSVIYNATAAAHQGGFPLLDCMQVSLVNSSVIYGQEDCLYLDVFLPLNINNETLLPVVISVARSSGFSGKILDIASFSGLFPGSGFFRISVFFRIFLDNHEFRIF
jgi:hypothetical protein